MTAYKAELDWKAKVAGKLPSFQIQRDPSKAHIAKRKWEEFKQDFPVSDSPPPVSWLIDLLRFCMSLGRKGSQATVEH